MKKIVFASMPLLLATNLYAQPGCEHVFLPDLAPVAGVHTPTINTGFKVAPPEQTETGLFYPFFMQWINDGSGTTGSLTITQIVGVPQKASKTWYGVRSVALVNITSRIYLDSAERYRDFYGQWRTWDKARSSQIIGYTQLPDDAYFIPGIESTWNYREDFRYDRESTNNHNLSRFLQLGERWNVGYFAPYGLYEANLQVLVRICR